MVFKFNWDPVATRSIQNGLANGQSIDNHPNEEFPSFYSVPPFSYNFSPQISIHDHLLTTRHNVPNVQQEHTQRANNRMSVL
jgi:hypothetical protein